MNRDDGFLAHTDEAQASTFPSERVELIKDRTQRAGGVRVASFFTRGRMVSGNARRGSVVCGRGNDGRALRPRATRGSPSAVPFRRR